MPADILILCTGNATRSVLAGVALAQRRPDLRIATAGTLAIDGLPISWRTRAAFEDVRLPVPAHRSRQATEEMVVRADLIVALAPEHVSWVRREHPDHASRTGTLIRLAGGLASEPGDLAARIRRLALGGAELDASEEVVDPGGGEVDAFIAAARQIDALVDRLAPVL